MSAPTSRGRRHTLLSALPYNVSDAEYHSYVHSYSNTWSVLRWHGTKSRRSSNIVVLSSCYTMGDAGRHDAWGDTAGAERRMCHSSVYLTRVELSSSAERVRRRRLYVSSSLMQRVPLVPTARLDSIGRALRWTACHSHFENNGNDPRRVQAARRRGQRFSCRTHRCCWLWFCLLCYVVAFLMLLRYFSTWKDNPLSTYDSHLRVFPLAHAAGGLILVAADTSVPSNSSTPRSDPSPSPPLLPTQSRATRSPSQARSDGRIVSMGRVNRSRSSRGDGNSAATMRRHSSENSIHSALLQTLVHGGVSDVKFTSRTQEGAVDSSSLTTGRGPWNESSQNVDNDGGFERRGSTGLVGTKTTTGGRESVSALHRHNRAPDACAAEVSANGSITFSCGTHDQPTGNTQGTQLPGKQKPHREPATEGQPPDGAPQQPHKNGEQPRRTQPRKFSRQTRTRVRSSTQQLLRKPSSETRGDRLLQHEGRPGTLANKNQTHGPGGLELGERGLQETNGSTGYRSEKVSRSREGEWDQRQQDVRRQEQGAATVTAAHASQEGSTTRTVPLSQSHTPPRRDTVKEPSSSENGRFAEDLKGAQNILMADLTVHLSRLWRKHWLQAIEATRRQPYKARLSALQIIIDQLDVAVNSVILSRPKRVSVGLGKWLHKVREVFIFVFSTRMRLGLASANLRPVGPLASTAHDIPEESAEVVEVVTSASQRVLLLAPPNRKENAKCIVSGPQEAWKQIQASLFPPSVEAQLVETRASLAKLLDLFGESVSSVREKHHEDSAAERKETQTSGDASTYSERSMEHAIHSHQSNSSVTNSNVRNETKNVNHVRSGAQNKNTQGRRSGYASSDGHIVGSSNGEESPKTARSVVVFAPESGVLWGGQRESGTPSGAPAQFSPSGKNADTARKRSATVGISESGFPRDLAGHAPSLAKFAAATVETEKKPPPLIKSIRIVSTNFDSRRDATVHNEGLRLDRHAPASQKPTRDPEKKGNEKASNMLSISTTFDNRGDSRVHNQRLSLDLHTPEIEKPTKDHGERDSEQHPHSLPGISTHIDSEGSGGVYHKSVSVDHAPAPRERKKDPEERDTEDRSRTLQSMSAISDNRGDSSDHDQSAAGFHVDGPQKQQKGTKEKDTEEKSRTMLRASTTFDNTADNSSDDKRNRWDLFSPTAQEPTKALNEWDNGKKSRSMRRTSTSVDSRGYGRVRHKDMFRDHALEPQKQYKNSEERDTEDRLRLIRSTARRNIESSSTYDKSILSFPARPQQKPTEDTEETEADEKYRTTRSASTSLHSRGDGRVHDRRLSLDVHAPSPEKPTKGHKEMDSEEHPRSMGRVSMHADNKGHGRIHHESMFSERIPAPQKQKRGREETNIEERARIKPTLNNTSDNRRDSTVHDKRSILDFHAPTAQARAKEPDEWDNENKSSSMLTFGTSVSSKGYGVAHNKGVFGDHAPAPQEQRRDSEERSNEETSGSELTFSTNVDSKRDSRPHHKDMFGVHALGPQTFTKDPEETDSERPRCMRRIGSTLGSRGGRRVHEQSMHGAPAPLKMTEDHEDGDENEQPGAIRRDSTTFGGKGYGSVQDERFLLNVHSPTRQTSANDLEKSDEMETPPVFVINRENNDILFQQKKDTLANASAETHRQHGRETNNIVGDAELREVGSTGGISSVEAGKKTGNITRTVERLSTAGVYETLDSEAAVALPAERPVGGNDIPGGGVRERGAPTAFTVLSLDEGLGEGVNAPSLSQGFASNSARADSHIHLHVRQVDRRAQQGSIKATEEAPTIFQHERENDAHGSEIRSSDTFEHSLKEDNARVKGSAASGTKAVPLYLTRVSSGFQDSQLSRSRPFPSTRERVDTARTDDAAGVHIVTNSSSSSEAQRNFGVTTPRSMPFTKPREENTITGMRERWSLNNGGETAASTRTRHSYSSTNSQDPYSENDVRSDPVSKRTEAAGSSAITIPDANGEGSVNNSTIEDSKSTLNGYRANNNDSITAEATGGGTGPKTKDGDTTSSTTILEGRSPAQHIGETSTHGRRDWGGKRVGGQRSSTNSKEDMLNEASSRYTNSGTGIPHENESATETTSTVFDATVRSRLPISKELARSSLDYRTCSGCRETSSTRTKGARGIGDGLETTSGSSDTTQTDVWTDDTPVTENWAISGKQESQASESRNCPTRHSRSEVAGDSLNNCSCSSVKTDRGDVVYCITEDSEDDSRHSKRSGSVVDGLPSGATLGSVNLPSTVVPTESFLGGSELEMGKPLSSEAAEELANFSQYEEQQLNPPVRVVDSLSPPQPTWFLHDSASVHVEHHGGTHQQIHSPTGRGGFAGYEREAHDELRWQPESEIDQDEFVSSEQWQMERAKLPQNLMLSTEHLPKRVVEQQQQAALNELSQQMRTDTLLQRHNLQAREQTPSSWANEWLQRISVTNPPLQHEEECDSGCPSDQQMVENIDGQKRSVKSADQEHGRVFGDHFGELQQVFFSVEHPNLDQLSVASSTDSIPWQAKNLPGDHHQQQVMRPAHTLQQLQVTEPRVELRHVAQDAVERELQPSPQRVQDLRMLQSPLQTSSAKQQHIVGKQEVQGSRAEQAPTARQSKEELQSLRRPQTRKSSTSIEYKLASQESLSRGRDAEQQLLRNPAPDVRRQAVTDSSSGSGETDATSEGPQEDSDQRKHLPAIGRTPNRRRQADALLEKGTLKADVTERNWRAGVKFLPETTAGEAESELLQSVEGGREKRWQLPRESRRASGTALDTGGGDSRESLHVQPAYVQTRGARGAGAAKEESSLSSTMGAGGKLAMKETNDWYTTQLALQEAAKQPNASGRKQERAQHRREVQSRTSHQTQGTPESWRTQQQIRRRRLRQRDSQHHSSREEGGQESHSHREGKSKRRSRQKISQQQLVQLHAALHPSAGNQHSTRRQRTSMRSTKSQHDLSTPPPRKGGSQSSHVIRSAVWYRKVQLPPDREQKGRKAKSLVKNETNQSQRVSQHNHTHKEQPPQHARVSRQPHHTRKT